MWSMFEHMYKWSEETEPERVSVGRASQAEGTARSKAPRQEVEHLVHGTGRRPEARAQIKVDRR